MTSASVKPMQDHRFSTPDEMIVTRLIAKDESALREVIQHHGPLVLSVARSVLGDAQLAEEVAQDVFVTVWNQADRFDSARGSLKTYLCRIGRNKAIDRLRHEQVQYRSEAVGDFAPHAGHEAGVDDRLLIAAAFHKLSEEQREAITLAYLEGHTYRQVAVELGIPEGTAKTRIRDALIVLRRVLRDPTAA